MKKVLFFVSALVLFGTGNSVIGKEIVITPKNPEKLEQAVKNLKTGDTLKIQSGTYIINNTLTLSKLSEVKIIGDGKVDILLKDVYQDVFDILSCGTVILSNIHAQHLEPLDHYECHGVVLYISDCGGVFIQDCELNGCGAIGISGNHIDKLSVVKCFIHNNSYCALNLSSIIETEILKNIIKNNKSFAQFYDCGNIMMYGNEIINNQGYWEEMGD